MFDYQILETQKEFTFSETLYVDISQPNNPISPIIELSEFTKENTIGICDDIILDARNSQNLGISYTYHVIYVKYTFCTFALQ